jgi:hypothetical protein
MVGALQGSLERNTAVGVQLDEQLVQGNKQLAEGNRIIRRKALWIAITCTSILVDVIVTVVLGVLGYNVHLTSDKTAAVAAKAESNAAALRANTCNLNTLFAQSIRNSGNTVDLYKGLRPLLAASTDPSSRAAVRFIDMSIANITSTARTRADFLTLTRDTARRLHCPAGFVPVS